MKLKIEKINEKSFTGGVDGQNVPYFWVRAVRLSDGVTITFGTPHAAFAEGEEAEVALEKREGRDGRVRYFQVP